MLRLIRLAKTTALVGITLTCVCTALLVGWQTDTLLKEGHWPNATIAAVLNLLNEGRGGIYSTASSHESANFPGSHLVDELLAVHALIPLLTALILLLVFYFWLRRIQTDVTSPSQSL